MAKIGDSKNTMIKTRIGAKRESKIFQIIITIVIIVVLAFILFRKLTNTKPVILDSTKKQLVIGKSNLIAVYENKLALTIPFEVNANKDETFGDIVKKRNDAEVLDAVNKILPEKIDEVKRVAKGEVRLDVKNKKMAPETGIDDKRMILTSSLTNLFDELYYEQTAVAPSNENIIVDILNANGKAGYAKKTGEKIATNLSMKYNAANNDTPSDTSFVILRDITKEKAQEVVMELSEKYIKIRSDVNIPTLANIVVILGKEEKISFEIHVIGKSAAAGKATEDLKSQGYKNVKNNLEVRNVDDNLIEYNPDDYYIAYKVSRLLNIKNMIEKEDLSDRLNIIMK
ncbi:MAG: LytR C-terminal domain-containing protein [Fusobacteriaceae bacterium]|jgi:hypothetical protein|nr:LytR C-terminal domain-containing protein [Fusobacteriaceae bacterium]